MSCGKKKLVKNWDHPRNIRVITPSRFEQNEASVKVHWKKVVRDLELSYKDDQFWETQCDTVRHLLGPKHFRQVAKIFHLPLEAKAYEPQSETSSLEPSEKFYTTSKSNVQNAAKSRSRYSLSDLPVEEEEMLEEEEQDEESSWSASTISAETKKSSSKNISKSQSAIALSKVLQARSFSRYFSRTLTRQASKTISSSKSPSTIASAHSLDDLDVCVSRPRLTRHRKLARKKNPYYEMLYCHESETDMIKWKSKYKVKLYEISASDEMSKKAEIVSKQISREFYDWWVGLGNLEFKSEIKRPEDIESLFQVWFDEHASRGLKLHPKILPCVLASIANFVGAPKAACPEVLKRQIEWDIDAETTPAHIMAFGTCLPHKMKHIPPNNNTKEMWGPVKIPEDLRSMACVWGDISHLTSTKAFQKWLEMRPHLPMPQFFKADTGSEDKKVPFLIPSDFVIKDKDSSGPSTQELALPVSQFSIELTKVLSKLMNP